MKQILILIIVSFSLSVYGQTSIYHPFPDSNASWCCESEYYDQPYCNSSWIKYELVRDTFFNGQIYHILLSEEIKDYFSCFLGNITFDYSTSNRGSFFIRQDSALKKVWFFDQNNNRDKILYNFNFNVGDSLDTTNVYWGGNLIQNDYMIITSIDSILINGNYRKRYNYNGSYDVWEPIDSSIIEGIGALNGPFSGIYSGGIYKFTQNNEVLLPEGFDSLTVTHFSGTNCSKILYVENNLKTQQSFLFPNPFHISATLKTSFLKADLKIYNLIGMMIRDEKIISESTEIFRTNLPAGLYFYELIGEHGEIIRSKFVIE